MYIRTKGEILKALDTDYMCGVKVYHTEKGMITEKLVVKTADNLAELCDGFYIDKCKEEFLYDEIFDECWYDFNPYFKACAKNGIDVFGFIKTDKGFQYIAKLNSKGELELL